MEGLLVIKMSIQYFPGHMSKALRQVEAKLKYVDIVLELRDARIPHSSSNPKIEAIIKRKPRLILLTKASMAEMDKTEMWINYFHVNNVAALAIDAITNFQIDKIAQTARFILKIYLKRKTKRVKSKTF